MKTYNIPMSGDDINLVILSVNSFAKNLTDALITIRENSDKATVRDYVASIIGQGEQNKQTFSQQANPNVAYAPHGIKKNGEPSKRRGRPLKAKKVAA
jgi:hypothetical protein